MKSVRFVVGALAALVVGCGGVELEQEPGTQAETPVSGEMGEQEQAFTVSIDDCTCSPMATRQNVPLADLTAQHDGCTVSTLTHSSNPGVPRACVSAAHRWCRARNFSGAAVTEFGPNWSYLEVGCFKAARYEGVHVNELAAFHSGCNWSSSTSLPEYTNACNAAANRFCKSGGHVSGALQDIYGSGYFNLSCDLKLDSSAYVSGVALSTLGCTQADIDTVGGGVSKGCASRANRFCQGRGAVGGFIVEVGAGYNLDIFCYKS